MLQVVYDAEELQYDSDTGRYYFMRENQMYYPALSPLPTVPVVTDSDDDEDDDDSSSAIEYDWFVPLTPEREPRTVIIPDAPRKNVDNIIPSFENLSVARRLF